MTNKKNQKPLLKDSVGFKLFKIVFSIYFSLSIIITFIQVLSEYRFAKNDILNELKEIKDSFKEGVIGAMWRESPEQVKTLAKGILRLPAVKGILIQDNFGEVYANFGRTTKKKGTQFFFEDEIFWLDFKLVKLKGEKKTDIGTIRIFSSRGAAFQRVKFGFYLLLIFAVLKTFILFWLFFWAFKRHLIVPLNNLANAAKAINMDRLLKINIGIKREKSLNKGNNELEIVEDSMNSMIENLSNAKVTLDKYSSGLEKEVEKKSKKIEAQYQDFKNLLFNLDQGFLIFDKEGIVKAESTEITKELFNTDPMNKKVEDIFQLSSSEKMNFNKWLSHVFKNLVPFKDLLPLAPKNFDKLKGKVVSLDYKPIYEDNKSKKIDKIICTATDVTEKVKLEKEAQLEKDKAKRISNILDRPLEFLDLMNDSEEVLDHYNKNIRDSRPDKIFRSFHTLKARFASFNLNDIVEAIHNLESFLNEIETDWSITNINKSRELIDYINYSRSNFIKDNNRLIEIANNSINNSDDSGNVISLKNHINNFFDVYQKNFILKEVSFLFKQFISPTMELAKQQDKLVEIKIDKSDIHINPDSYKELFSSLLHVFRNAIDHGIESREERVAKNKKEMATLYIFFDRTGDTTFKTIIKDDGRGIDPKVIKEIASQKESFKSLAFDKLSEKEIIQLIFEPGFSSKEEVSEISGRGVGMDAVKTEVESLKGTIKVDSKVDIGTKVEIVLPIYD